MWNVVNLSEIFAICWLVCFDPKFYTLFNGFGLAVAKWVFKSYIFQVRFIMIIHDQRLNLKECTCRCYAEESIADLTVCTWLFLIDHTINYLNGNNASHIDFVGRVYRTHQLVYRCTKKKQTNKVKSYILSNRPLLLANKIKLPVHCSGFMFRSLSIYFLF